MAGTVTVVYTNNRIDLRQKLARIQKVFLKEVISSQHVFLEEDHSLEVLLVQGPNRRLQMLRDEIMSCKGVTTAKLTLTGELLPPLH
jgi:CopG family nickel-responsive transcriptional regulator